MFTLHYSFLIVFVLVFILVYILVFWIKKFWIMIQRVKLARFLRTSTFRDLNITVVETELDCQLMCQTLRSKCNSKLRILGFDCEWVNKRPVSLLQLSSADGCTVLFRLNKLEGIPKPLIEILEDSSIIKLGVSCKQDASFLSRDYNVEVKGCLDLRFLYNSSRGLAFLAFTVLNVHLDKDWKVAASNWENSKLTDTQILYSAKDAFVAVQIFKMWILENAAYPLHLWEININFENLWNQSLQNSIQRYINLNYNADCNQSKSSQIQNERIKARAPYATRKKPLYDNCFMHAPDGELLCSCDQKKAQWYIEKGLAVIKSNEPFSIQLTFEPSARGGNENDEKFHAQLKKNCCVVCGKTESYLKHYVVPREYRQFFPREMKDHQSHDVVLTCISCHMIASKHDYKLREKLADMCDAPFSSKTKDLRDVRKLQSAANALLKSGDSLPDDRKTYLQNIVRDYFGVSIVTNELLKEALAMKSTITNESYQSHGLQVVTYFMKNRSILEFETMWRKHFLDSMKPEFLPAFWSIKHNHERLKMYNF